MSCEQHKKEIAGISNMKVLAEMIGDLHYETLAELLRHLELKFWDDALKDKINNRHKLADCLYGACMDINCCQDHIEMACKISKPFMKAK